MKKHIIAYTCFLALNIYAAEEKQQQITFYNKNVHKIDVNLYLQKLISEKNLNYDSEQHNIPLGQQKSFETMDQNQSCKMTFELCLPNIVVPELVLLHVTDNGDLRPGDTIVVKSVDNQIEIENIRSNRVLLCNSCIEPIIIGSDPANFPSSTRIEQLIYIANTDLLQVSVVNETTVLLAKGGMRGFTITPYLYENKNIRKRLRLIIPEAKQNVLVNINEGEINSDDTLQVSWSEDKRKILIHRTSSTRPSTLLAYLYPKKTTFG